MKHEVLPYTPDRLVSYIRNRSGEVVGYAFAELLPGVRKKKEAGTDETRSTPLHPGQPWQL